MDPLLIYWLVLLTASVGLVISTLEYWVIAPSFAPSGVYSWDILQLQGGGSVRAALARGYERLGIKPLLAVRLLTLLGALAVGFESPLFTAFLGVHILTNIAFTYRRVYGDDGSDQMTTIVLVTVFLCVGPHSTEFLLTLGLAFIAGQACVSYASAGIAKLVSPLWRGGEAVYRVFNTTTYGLEWVADLLRGRRWLGLLLAWNVMIAEALFPLVLVLPEPWFWLFLAWGAVFHLQCAVIMGLNSFLWAFLATYPAIVYIGGLVRGVLY